MFSVHTHLFYDVFDSNMKLYNEFISMIRSEYVEIIYTISNTTDIQQIRIQIHKLIGILHNLHASELMYICVLLLSLDKHNEHITYEHYDSYIKQIISYEKIKIGL